MTEKLLDHKTLSGIAWLMMLVIKVFPMAQITFIQLNSYQSIHGIVFRISFTKEIYGKK